MAVEKSLFALLTLPHATDCAPVALDPPPPPPPTESQIKAYDCVGTKRQKTMNVVEYFFIARKPKILINTKDTTSPELHKTLNVAIFTILLASHIFTTLQQNMPSI
jgi:hypothetical protein